MDADTLLEPADVARLCGVTPAAVRRWANLGQLPAILTASGRRLFRRADVEALRAKRQLAREQAAPKEATDAV
jgi:DNA-binding transcriptional MerR regulator